MEREEGLSCVGWGEVGGEERRRRMIELCVCLWGDRGEREGNGNGEESDQTQ